MIPKEIAVDRVIERNLSAPVSGAADGSFSKLRDSLRRSSARLLQRLAGRHSLHLPPDVDPESMKRARSLSELSKESAGVRNEPPGALRP
ncbi:unnamed protein product, partial [Iphiclides podalirius]